MAHDRKESYDKRNARNNPRRVRDAELYVGMAPRPEHAQVLNDDMRRFRDRQKQSRT